MYLMRQKRNNKSLQKCWRWECFVKLQETTSSYLLLQGLENSRMYNEMVLLKLTQSLTKIVRDPPPTFRNEVLQHFRSRGQDFATRCGAWSKVSPADKCIKGESSQIMKVKGSTGYPLVAALDKFASLNI